MFQWLLGRYQKRVQVRQSDRSERNAVIRRIVTAAATTTPKKDAAAVGEVAGPFTLAIGSLSPTDSGGIPRDKVADRAYEIWVQNGRPTGTAERDWQQALRELTAAAEAATP